MRIPTNYEEKHNVSNYAREEKVKAPIPETTMRLIPIRKRAKAPTINDGDDSTGNRRNQKSTTQLHQIKNTLTTLSNKT
ncbi:26314_t:CDS:2, partial [Gigaspora rosea]